MKLPLAFAITRASVRELLQKVFGVQGRGGGMRV
jgi:hypothetical protein